VPKLTGMGSQTPAQMGKNTILNRLIAQIS
jgi:hypothetical protein